MSSTRNTFSKGLRLNKTQACNLHVGIATPMPCQRCEEWQWIAMEEILYACFRNKATVHLEIDSAAAVALHDVLKRCGDTACGYSSAQSIDELSRWQGASGLHVVKHFGQIFFTGSVPAERDAEMYNAVSALIIMDCHHSPFRSIVGNVPTEVRLGIVSQGFSTSMMRRLMEAVQKESSEVAIDSSGKRLCMRLLQSL